MTSHRVVGTFLHVSTGLSRNSSGRRCPPPLVGINHQVAEYCQNSHSVECLLHHLVLGRDFLKQNYETLFTK